MTQREKVILARVYGVLDGLSGLRARNPADIKTISRYHAAVPDVLRPLNMAVSCLGYGDLVDAGEYLDSAEAQLPTGARPMTPSDLPEQGGRS